jgi:3-deoxy-D-manno-octulosonic-acid transferase
MSFAWTAYRMLAPCLGALAPAARMFASPYEKPLWIERLGRVGLAGGAHAWVHAASLGEASAVGPLVHELLSLQPAARLFLTTNTRTGRERLLSLGQPLSLAPIDSPQAVRRFFAGVQPQRLIVVETEIWPHWLLRAATEGIPVAVVSARLSERSVTRYGKLGMPLRRLVAGLEAVLCQTETDRDRWLALGARPERTEVVGNLKHDAIASESHGREAARTDLGLDRDRPLFVLGSLRPGEARLLARAWMALPASVRERWQVAAVPRHARASADLREEASRAGVTASTNGVGANTWRWDDRSGVLNAYYEAADASFVGGSLFAYGGHNPMEPAAFGSAVLIGPHHAAQADAVRALAERDAIRVVSVEELEPALAAVLGDDAMRERLGCAAREVVESQRGVARRVVARLSAWGLWPAE